MGDALFCTRLRWASGSGLAKLRNRSVVLTAQPDIGLEIDELVYTPEVNVARVREVGKPWRELRPSEIRACDAFLKRTVEPGES